MLSIPAMPIAEIAAITGYGSNDALGLAFRRAALPAPRDVRLAILA